MAKKDKADEKTEAPAPVAEKPAEKPVGKKLPVDLPATQITSSYKQDEAAGPEDASVAIPDADRVDWKAVRKAEAAAEKQDA